MNKEKKIQTKVEPKVPAKTNENGKGNGHKSGNGKKKQVHKIEMMMEISPKKVLGGLLVLFLAFSFLTSFMHPALNAEEVDLSKALNDVKSGEVKKVQIDGDRLILTYQNDVQYFARKEPGESLVKTFESASIDPKSVEVQVVDQTVTNTISSVFGTLLPLILMGVFFLFLFRQARGAQDSIFSFGQSKAKIFAKGKQNITFKDVAGVDEAKKELEEVVDFLKNPQKYKALGARTPKGVLLFGPSGVGKTLLAKAVAGEAGVAFFSMAGSEFMEMLVGVGASRVRDLFSTAKKAAPSIIFIDEIDAIGRQRGGGMMSGGHDEREQTLNQILVEMDGFTPNDNVMVIAATNRGDLLDPALLRPGRFDRRVTLDMPDVEGREAILKIHARGKTYAEGIDWIKVAKRTVGFSGADLENMLNESAILAARENKKSIEPKDIEEAAVKVKLGPERKRLQSEEDRKMTAYHEAGHAIVNFYSDNVDPVHRISIIARGMSLGHTMMAPTKDRSHETKTRLLEQISVLLGGRVAEELIFNEMTTGAANDLSIATRIARAMVINFGMSKLGPVYLGPQQEESEMGRLMFYEPTSVSPDKQKQIDDEVNRISEEAYKRTEKLIEEHRDKLDAVAEALLEKETIEGEEFETIMQKSKLVKF